MPEFQLTYTFMILNWCKLVVVIYVAKWQGCSVLLRGIEKERIFKRMTISISLKDALISYLLAFYLLDLQITWSTLLISSKGAFYIDYILHISSERQHLILYPYIINQLIQLSLNYITYYVIGPKTLLVQWTK